MPLQHPTSATWAELMKNKMVVVDFFATWCPPCRKIGPTFEAFSNDAKYANIIFAKVDVDEEGEITSNCAVQAMPTFQFYLNGQKAKEVVGANEAQIKAQLDAWSA